MTVPVRALTVNVFDQDGSPLVGATVTALLNSKDIYLDQYVMPITISAVSDASGIATLNLFPNVLGELGTHYRIACMHPVTGKRVIRTSVQIPDEDVILTSIDPAAVTAPVDVILTNTTLAFIYKNAAGVSAAAADVSAVAAAVSEVNAAASEANILVLGNTVGASEIAAAASAVAAGLSESAASASEIAAAASDSAAGISETNASASEGNAAISEIGAGVSAILAQAWADNNENTEVVPGKYSAKHWATRAMEAAAGTLVYRGAWNASSTIYPVPIGTGDFYKITIAGTIGGTVFDIGDSIIYNGVSWDKIDNTELVTSVAGRTGAVTLTKNDVGLSNVADIAQVTSVSATSPIASSGGTAPVISMPAASAGINGYMTGVYATQLDTVMAGSITLSTAAQPNITSLGELTLLKVTAALPVIWMHENDQAADAGGWIHRVNGGAYQLLVVNDIGTGLVTAASVTRGGTWTFPGVSAPLNGTVGGVTPAAGAFTTGAFSGNLTLSNTTAPSLIRVDTADVTNSEEKLILGAGISGVNFSEIGFARGTAYTEGYILFRTLQSGVLAEVLRVGQGAAVTVTGTLASTGILSTTDTTDATSATAASLKTAGGIASVKSAWIGASLNVVGTLTGEVGTAASWTLRLNTADGADSSYLALAGGGAASVARGANIVLGGNEQAAIPGYVQVSAGNITGALLQLRTGNGIVGLEIARGAGGTVAGAVTIPSLAGTGTRTVVVDANGVMSAP